MALPATTDFISWWGLQEASGTRSDEAASSNDLTENGTGGVGQGTGIVDTNCADFESTDTDNLAISNASQTGLNFTGDFSMGAWIKMEDTDAVTIMGKYQNAASGQYIFRVQGNNNRWGVSLVSSGSATNLWQTDTTVATGTWFFLVATYDASAGNAVYYRDGTSIGTVGGGPSSIDTSGETFYLGAFQTGSTNNYDGLMEQAFIANKVLSSDEVTSLWNSGNGTTWSDISGGGGAAVTPTPNLLTLGVG